MALSNIRLTRYVRNGKLITRKAHKRIYKKADNIFVKDHKYLLNKIKTWEITEQGLLNNIKQELDKDFSNTKLARQYNKHYINLALLQDSFAKTGGIYNHKAYRLIGLKNKEGVVSHIAYIRTNRHSNSITVLGLMSNPSKLDKHSELSLSKVASKIKQDRNIDIVKFQPADGRLNLLYLKQGAKLTPDTRYLYFNRFFQ